VTVLFTEGESNLVGGCEHLTCGGIWIKQYEESGLRKATAYCLDKTVLNEFVDPFGLTNIKVDVEIEVEGYYLSVVMITFWGKKLGAILDWKQQMEASLGTT
jgi:hypothetical protein